MFAVKGPARPAQANVPVPPTFRIPIWIPCPMLVSNMVSSNRMETARKITVEVPPELLEKAQRASGSGITQTVRTGLQLVAASHAYAQLRQLRGKVRFSLTAAELKDDR